VLEFVLWSGLRHRPQRCCHPVNAHSNTIGRPECAAHSGRTCSDGTGRYHCGCLVDFGPAGGRSMLRLNQHRRICRRPGLQLQAGRWSTRTRRTRHAAWAGDSAWDLGRWASRWRCWSWAQVVKRTMGEQGGDIPGVYPSGGLSGLESAGLKSRRPKDRPSRRRRHPGQVESDDLLQTKPRPA
jgi:hypothetical protein